MMPLIRGAWTALIVGLVAIPTSAFGQEGGVFYDPDSPAGTEYVIPLEESRRDAAPDFRARPDSGDQAAASPTQPLFGIGIERTGSGGSTTSGGERSDTSGLTAKRKHPSAKRDRPGNEGSDSVVGGAAKPVGTDATEAAVKAAADGSPTGLLVGGIVAAVLCAGLLVGLGIRRSARG